MYSKLNQKVNAIFTPAAPERSEVLMEVDPRRIVTVIVKPTREKIAESTSFWRRVIRELHNIEIGKQITIEKHTS